MRRLFGWAVVLGAAAAVGCGGGGDDGTGGNGGGPETDWIFEGSCVGQPSDDGSFNCVEQYLKVPEEGEFSPEGIFESICTNHSEGTFSPDRCPDPDACCVLRREGETSWTRNCAHEYSAEMLEVFRNICLTVQEGALD